MRLFRTLALAMMVALTATMAVPVAAHATPNRYYVDCSGKRAGGGSSASPWNSLAGVNAHGAFTAGDSILLRRGTTCRGRLMPTGSGGPGAPIVLGAWGRGAKPTLAGGGTPDLTGAVQLLNQAYWTIQDLHVTNTGGGTSTQVYRSGVSVRNQDGGALPGIVIQRMTVDHVASAPNELGGSSREWGGITVAAGGVEGDSFPGLMIRNNRVDHVGRTGIAVMNWEFPTTFNRNVRITGNRVSWARGDGIIVFGAQHARIDHNVVANSADEWPCPLCGPITPLTANAGIWPARSSYVQIDHNEVYGMRDLGGDGEAFDSDQSTDHVVFEYNYAHDNAGGGVFFCGSADVTVRFNIFEDNRRSTFVFIGNVPAHNTSIYNNTIYNKDLAITKALRTFNVDKATSPAGRVVFKNNIVFNYSKYSHGWWQWPGKLVTTSANTLVGIHGEGRPHDRRTSRKNPHLRAPGTGGTGFDTLRGYRPTKHHAHRHGVPIPSDATRDFFGNRIDPKHPPRGAAA